MKKMMKKIAESLLGLVALIAMMLGCAENADGSCNLPWTLSCFAVAAVCGRLWSKCFGGEPVHVTEQAYRDLNALILGHASGMGEDGSKEIWAEAELPEGRAVTLHARLHASSSESRFTDGAWGAVQTFTERNRTCRVEILGASVTGDDGEELESDFDGGRIETEYSGTEWI